MKEGSRIALSDCSVGKIEVQVGKKRSQVGKFEGQVGKIELQVGIEIFRTKNSLKGFWQSI